MRRGNTSGIYCTSYCNMGHRISDGKPVEHECRIIPVKALRAEMAGDTERTNKILSSTPARMMRRGVRRDGGEK